MGDFFFYLACAALAAATVLVVIERVFGKGTRRTDDGGE